MQRLLLEVIPCLLAGLVLGRAFPTLPARLAPPLVRWGVPFSLVGLLLQAGLRAELLGTAVLALAGPGIGLLLLRRLPGLSRRIPAGALQLGSFVGNTAYWGLPVGLALLPPAAIAHTIAYDLAGTLFTWTVGPLLVGGVPARGAALMRTLGESPACRGLLFALVLQATPWRGPLAAVLWWPARMVVFLALLLVGMRLGLMLWRRHPAPPTAPGLEAALAMKLLASPALLLLLSLVAGLPPAARNAVVLQGAAPTAIAVLLLAEAEGTDGDAAAGLVLWSTALALGTVPLWWWLLQGPLGA